MQRRSLTIIAGIGVLLIAWLWSGYNGLIGAQGAVQAQWAQVETQYQRRFDLIPNLVSTVKGAADFEQSTFRAVTAARSQWQSSTSLADKVNAANQFDSALSRLLVTVEAYPQLQATQAFRDLMTQLEGTENRISVARRDFNGEAASYNVRVRRFPGNILAGIFGFEEQPLFSATEGADVAPKVDFQ